MPWGNKLSHLCLFHEKTIWLTKSNPSYHKLKFIIFYYTLINANVLLVTILITQVFIIFPMNLLVQIQCFYFTTTTTSTNDLLAQLSYFGFIGEMPNFTRQIINCFLVLLLSANEPIVFLLWGWEFQTFNSHERSVPTSKHYTLFGHNSKW